LLAFETFDFPEKLPKKHSSLFCETNSKEEIKYNSIDTWTQYYLTFYDHNLQMLKINAIMFALGKPFQPIFAC